MPGPIRLILLGAILIPGMAFGDAVSPAGSLICSGTFLFNGVRMIAGGVYSWPVLPGDEIFTESLPATLLFDGKSRIVLDPNTRVRIANDGKSVSVTLETGSLRYARTRDSRVRIRTGTMDGPDAICGSVAVQSGRATWNGVCSTSKPGERATPPIPASLGMHRPQ